jgi:rhamnogalacturonyl hydrolase YesR
VAVDSVNHHADHPGFAGMTGLLTGLIMSLAGGAAAHLAAAVPDGDRRFLAIERLVRSGATGLSSHGWITPQANSFAAQCWWPAW